MNTNIYKNQGQFQLLIDAFEKERMEDPEISTIQALNRAVTSAGFSARTITRGVNELVDKKDYCIDIDCDGCVDHHDKESLKHWLHHFAWPPVLKIIHYTVEEVMEMRSKGIRL